jgi:large subunit ribosomal protein L10
LLTRESKRTVVNELKGKLETAQAIYVVDYKGISVAGMTELRNRLRGANSMLRVAKNTLTRIAANDAGVQELEALLDGPVALAMSYGEPATTAKVLSNFMREFKILEIKGGILEGRVLSGDEVKVLADLPPYEVLVARVVGGIKAPLYGLAGVLNGPMRNLVYVLEAIREKKAS